MHFEGFEGGQSPLQRRLPKRGFTNIHRAVFEVVNVDALSVFPAGTVLTLDAMVEAGLVNKAGAQVKVLGEGELSAALTVYAHRFSASAKAKIEAAGGKAELIVTKA
jgi:large subunit ribosomal protein L15